MDSEERFERLLIHYAVTPDRKGECWVTCPACGKEGHHFSFSVRGAHCFVCGFKSGLAELCRMAGIEDSAPIDKAAWREARARRERAARPAQQVRVSFAALAEQYAHRPDRFERWAQYRPLPPSVIDGYGLGIGAYPRGVSACQHDRLQVPITDGAQVIGLRGRQIVCDCQMRDGKPARWLSPLGSTMSLFNGRRLGPQDGIGLGFALGERRIQGGILYIVENPIDALMMELADPDGCAVGTLGVSNWRPAWTQAVGQARPAVVIIAFDNDRPGNGGGERGRQEWLKTHGRDIKPGAQRIAEEIAALHAGIRVEIAEWPKDAPQKVDVGDALLGIFDVLQEAATDG